MQTVAITSSPSQSIHVPSGLALLIASAIRDGERRLLSTLTFEECEQLDICECGTLLSVHPDLPSPGPLTSRTPSAYAAAHDAHRGRKLHVMGH